MYETDEHFDKYGDKDVVVYKPIRVLFGFGYLQKVCIDGCSLYIITGANPFLLDECKTAVWCPGSPEGAGKVFPVRQFC